MINLLASFFLAEVDEKRLFKSIADKPPTIALVTSLFLENLAVSQGLAGIADCKRASKKRLAISVISDSNTVHSFSLNGDSNLYTVGKQSFRGRIFVG